ncbi:MAG: SDR family NAD(P)-dependent oxidoreductase [Tabrizicola flagellatus]|uniref:SDR family NAD(P)-dependent oxidoreductase n=1 Tax=Tabrizicola flagellatus TaxID=2593021 RepID=UPI00391DD923
MNRPLPNAIYPGLKGRTAFVTGGATGIGCAMVTPFARQGMRVGFCDIAIPEGEALAASLGAAGHEARFDPVDVRDTDALQQALRNTADRWATIDVLVNNVANDSRQDWRDLTCAEWDNAMAINLRPAFFAIQAVPPGMIAREHGSIIDLGSISWKAKYGTMPAYTTAKAAIHGLTRSYTVLHGLSYRRWGNTIFVSTRSFPVGF